MRGVLLLTSSLLLYRWRFLVDIAVALGEGHKELDTCTWSGWVLTDLYLYEEAGYGGLSVVDRLGVVLQLGYRTLRRGRQYIIRS